MNASKSSPNFYFYIKECKVIVTLKMVKTFDRKAKKTSIRET